MKSAARKHPNTLVIYLIMMIISTIIGTHAVAAGIQKSSTTKVNSATYFHLPKGQAYVSPKDYYRCA